MGVLDIEISAILRGPAPHSLQPSGSGLPTKMFFGGCFGSIGGVCARLQDMLGKMVACFPSTFLLVMRECPKIPENSSISLQTVIAFPSIFLLVVCGCPQNAGFQWQDFFVS